MQVKQESVTIPTPPVQSTTMKYCSSGEKLTSIQCVFVFVLVYLYDCTVWSELFQIVCIPLVRLCFSKVPTPTWASPEITVKCSCVVQSIYFGKPKISCHPQLQMVELQVASYCTVSLCLNSTSTNEPLKSVQHHNKPLVLPHSQASRLHTAGRLYSLSTKP